MDKADRRFLRNLPLILVAIGTSAASFFGQPSNEPAQVSFSGIDSGTVCALEYGEGKRGVVLAHGGQFNKESWDPQARNLVKSGFRVLSIDFRGFGCSKGPGDDDILSAPLKNDVLAAVRYLLRTGTESVAVVGASLGGWAATAASLDAKNGEIDRIITLGSLTWKTEPERIAVPLLVVATRNDTSGSGPRLPAIRAAFEKVAGQKEMVIFEGSAHAQQMFATEDSSRVMQTILKFLLAK